MTAPTAQHALMKLAFSGHLIYDRNEDFRTAKYPFPFKLLEGEYSAQKVMVPLAGIEPALPKELDFESSASTNFTTGARGCPL